MTQRRLWGLHLSALATVPQGKSNQLLGASQSLTSSFSLCCLILAAPWLPPNSTAPGEGPSPAQPPQTAPAGGHGGLPPSHSPFSLPTGFPALLQLPGDTRDLLCHEGLEGKTPLKSKRARSRRALPCLCSSNFAEKRLINEQWTRPQ